jgi:hypothetical protein
MVHQNPENSDTFVHRFDEKLGEDGVLEVHFRIGAPFVVTAAYAGVLATLNNAPVRLVHNIPLTLDASPFRRYAEEQPPQPYVDSFLQETLAASGHQELLETMSYAQRTAAYWTAAQAFVTYFNPPK